MQFRQGLAAYRTTEAEVGRSYWLTLQAETYGNVRQIEEGLRILAEELVVVNNRGEHFYGAELYRLQGEMLLAQDGKRHQVEEAEESFFTALDTARQQQAKSLELRAAMSLARLWQSQDKRQDARDLLAPVYNWFTEGFDTADLQDAKGLLDELGA